MELLSIFMLFNLSAIELLLVIALFLPTIIAVIDIAGNKFEGNQQILWILIVILVPFGPYIYFIFGRKRRIKSK
jgi:hypothetical protein